MNELRKKKAYMYEREISTQEEDYSKEWVSECK